MIPICLIRHIKDCKDKGETIMNGNIYKAAGLAVGILVGLIIAAVLIVIANKNRKFKTEYDERQLKVRGDAYRYAFYTVVIWEAVLLILAIGEFSFPVSAYILHYAGILAGVLVLSGYCIWKDAYWGLNNNRKRYGIILVIAGLLNALPLISLLTSPQNSDFPYINVLTCVMLVAVGIELLIKHMIDKRAEAAEDEA